jgi:TIGR03009 family protein
MPMPRRIAKSTIAWFLASAAAFAQQPSFNTQQPGPVRQPLQQGAYNSGQTPANAAASQGQLQAQLTVEQQAAQQLLVQQQMLEQQLAKMPFEPLNEAQQKYLDQVLTIWEQRTAKIERYQCNFTRWVFDPSQNSNPDAASKAEGLLKFMEPDKGLFRIDKLEFFGGRDPRTNAPLYQENQRQKFGEYWICDGQYVHILDRNEKKCTKYQLPPENRGKGIYRSPLPFLFGVKAQEIYSRYWIRPIAPPANVKDAVYLETYPKRPDDAGNYSRVQIVLDAKEVLPKALIVFLPNWRADQQHREIYEFSNRSDRSGNALDKLQEAVHWKEDFIPTTLTKDWVIIVEPYEIAQAPGAAPAAGQEGATPRTAQPPGSLPLR